MSYCNMSGLGSYHLARVTEVQPSYAGFGAVDVDVSSASGVQTALNLLGASPQLDVDGQIGPMSKAAIRAFRASHGLPASDAIDPALQAALRSALAALPGAGGSTVRKSAQASSTGKTLMIVGGAAVLLAAIAAVAVRHKRSE
jgi:peptidoglycan hydrolase-like protein with peptidoglycan-binding domain